MSLLSIMATSMPTNFFGQVAYLFEEYYPLLLFGMKNTLLISLTGTIFGFLGGLILSSIRNMKNNPRSPMGVRVLRFLLRFITGAYIEIIRGTPMMVQSMVIYYGGRYVGLSWSSPIVAGIFVVSMNTTAYMAEIIRSGIQAIDKGQFEGASSLGMNDLQTMMYVILPQAIKNALPAIGNEFVVNIKDSSVLNVISVVELYFQTGSMAGTYGVFFPAFAIASVLYFIMTFTTTQILHWIERRMSMPKGSYPRSQTVPHAFHFKRGE